MLRVELSRLDLVASNPLRRSPPRPPEHRHPGYEEQFDHLTVLYDCFTAPDGRLVCIGPPLLNLRQAVVPAIERAFRKSFFSWCDVRNRDRHMQMWLKPRTPAGAIEGGLFEQRPLAIQPSHCELFRGRRVLMTKSKDNELIWIRDWVLFHAMNHGCDAVLFYDNNSTKYGAAQVHQAISSVPGIEVAVVVSWPFKYGPNAGPSGIWDSDFAQYAVLEHARHRFLAKADAVISADVDELVVTAGGQSVYDLAGRSCNGYLRYAGVMIENVTDRDLAGPRRHAHSPIGNRRRGRPPRNGRWCPRGAMPDRNGAFTN